MSSTFAALRKKSGGVEDIRNKFKKLQNGGGGRNPTLEDETFWDIKHVRGNEATGTATIRFLPAGPNEDDPIIKIEEYNWQGPGGYYIELSRRTLGADQADPAYEYNGSIFGDSSLTKDEKFKKLVNRKETYVANIEIISDPNKPENEGQRKRWRFGPQIYNIVNEALFPPVAGDEPINVFDPVDGANFRLVVITKSIPDRKTGNMTDVPSYEKSKFLEPSVYMEIEEFEEVWQTITPLKPIISEDKFKSYEDLKKILDRALGNGVKSKDEDDEPVERKPASKPKEDKKKSEKVSTPEKSETPPVDDDIPWEHPDPVSDNKTTADDSSSGEVDDVDDWLSKL